MKHSSVFVAEIGEKKKLTASQKAEISMLKAVINHKKKTHSTAHLTPICESVSLSLRINRESLFEVLSLLLHKIHAR